MVRYRCKAEQAANNGKLVRALFDELDQTHADGVRYAVFRLDDGVTFIHLVATETDAGLEPMGKLNAYRELQDGKLERFDEGPTVTELNELGSFGVFA